MVEAKTQLILESIKKKMEKLEEPRVRAEKDFSDLGDEFSYSAPTKKSTAVASLEEPVPLDSSRSELGFEEVAIEKENNDSFQFDDEELDDDYVEHQQDVNSLSDKQQEENDDEERDNKELRKETQEGVVENSEEEIYEEKERVNDGVVDEDEELQDIDPVNERNSEDLAEHQDDFDFDHGNLPDLDLDLEEESEEDFQYEPEEVLEEEVHEEEMHQEESQEIISKAEIAQPEVLTQNTSHQDDYEDLKTDEDELEELLKEEGGRSVDKDTKSVAAPAPAMPINQSIPVQPAQLSSTQSKKTFVDMNDFLSHTESATKASDSLLNNQVASNVSDSIKKLVDAKNVVSGVTSFSKSEAFVDIASHLMEPRLEKWLNENLPALVEKIVREEIKKIIPKE